MYLIRCVFITLCFLCTFPIPLQVLGAEGNAASFQQKLDRFIDAASVAANNSGMTSKDINLSILAASVVTDPAWRKGKHQSTIVEINLKLAAYLAHELEDRFDGCRKLAQDVPIILTKDEIHRQISLLSTERLNYYIAEVRAEMRRKNPALAKVVYPSSNEDKETANAR